MPVNPADFAEVLAPGVEPADPSAGKRVDPADFVEGFEPGERPGPQTLGQEFSQGVQAGTNQMQASLFGLADVAGSLLGSQGLQEWALEGIVNAQDDAERLAPTVGQISEIEDSGDFFDWAAGAIGQQVPVLASLIGSGGTGGILARASMRAALRNGTSIGARRLMARQFAGAQRGELTKAIARQLDDAATQRLLRQSFTRGAGLGAAASSFGIQAGDLQNQLTEAGIDSPLTAVVGGAAAAALDAAPVVVLLDRMFPGVDRALSKAFVQDIAKAMGMQGALEGGTEVAQEMVMLASRAFHDPTLDITSPANREQMLNAAAAGALVGSLTGGVGELSSLGARRSAKAAKSVKANADTLGDFVKSKVDVAQRIAAVDQGDDSIISGIGEMRTAAASYLRDEISPILSGASERLRTGAQAAKDALGVADLGIDLAGIATSLDGKVRARVAPILNQALTAMNRQVTAVREKAAQVAAPDRVQFLQDELSKVKQDIKNFIDQRLKPAVKSAEDELAEEVATANYTDPDSYDDESGYVDDPDALREPEDLTRVVFGQTQKRTRSRGGVTVSSSVRSRDADAVPFTSRSAADSAVAEVRASHPNLPEDAFDVEERDGGFVVAVRDIGAAEEVFEQLRFNDGLTDAREASRANPDQSRRIEVRKPGAKGWTRLDVPTLALAGQDIVERGGTKLPENRNKAAVRGLDTMIARMLDQGYEFKDGMNALRHKVLFDGMAVGQARGRAQFDPLAKLEADVKAAGKKLEALNNRISYLERKGRTVPAELKEQANKALEEFDAATRAYDTAIASREQQLEVEAEARPRPASEGAVFERRGPEAPIDVVEDRPDAFEARDLATPPSNAFEDRGVDDPEAAATRGIEDTEAAQNEAGKRAPRIRRRRQRYQSSKRLFVDLASLPEKEAEELGQLVVKLLDIVGLKTRVRLVDKQGAIRIAESGHPLGDVLVRGAMMDPKGFITTHGNEAIIYLSDSTLGGAESEGDLEAAKRRTVEVLAHELGHLVEFTYFRQIKDPELRRAISDAYDKSGSKLPFEEWMANQFTSWISRTQEPKTAVEKFFKSVATLIKQMWDYIRPKYQLDGSYKDFADGIADVAAGRTNSSNPFAQHFFNEGIVGRVWFTTAESRRAGSSSQEFLEFNPPELATGLKARVRKLLDEHPAVKQAGVRTWELLNWIHDNLIASLNGQLRRAGNPAMNKLADMLNRTPGDERKTPTYFNNVQLYRSLFAKEFNRILQGMDDATKARVMQELITGNITSNESAAIIQTFEQMYDYMIEAGLPVKKVKDYFPRVWDTELVGANEEKIVAKLKELGLSEQDASNVWASMSGSETNVPNPEDELDIPFEGFLQKRAKVLEDPFFRQFQSKDLDRTVERYLSGAVKRAEFNRFWGSDARKNKKNTKWDPRGAFNKLVTDAMKQGATESQVKLMQSAVDAALGRHGRDQLPVGARQAMSWLMTYQNLRLTMFAMLSSFPDLVGPAIRSNDFRGAWKTLRNGMKDIVDKESDLAEMARTWGIISDTLNQHVLTEHFDNHWMPERARRINEKWFRAIGLERWTNFVRTAALAVGRDFIKRKAAEGDDKALAELGLTSDEVRQWVDGGEHIYGSVGYDSSDVAGRKVAEALIQFVNESVMRPDASQRPLWASNPAFMLLFHLKSFIYAFHNTTLRQLYKNFKDAETPWQKAAVVAGPAMMMMALTGAGLELRELIQYKLWGRKAPTDSQSTPDYLLNLVERSGLYGLSQLAVDWENASERGQLPVLAIAGPTVQQLNDLVAKPLSQTVPKALPIVSQMPRFREFLRDATPL